MSTKTWLGDTANWYVDSQWNIQGGGIGFPIPGDTIFINGGTVNLSGADEAAFVPVDGEQINLGGTSAAAPAAIVVSGATIGHFSTLINSGTSSFALLRAIGAAGAAGPIVASAAGGALTIQATQANGTQAADFVLLHGGTINVSGGDNLILDGLFTAEGGVTIAAASTLTNNGTAVLYGGTTSLLSGATLQGTGTFVANADATLVLSVPVPSTQTIAYGPAGRVNLGDVAEFAGTITNFLQGDTIDLLNIAATSASFDAGTDLLTITNGATPVATIHMVGPPTGTLATVTDKSGGTLIDYPNSPTRLSLEIGTADEALKSNIVRQTMTAASGAPITGAGIKIGIMSDSFNATLSGITDPADAAAQLGFLPQTTLGASAVTILQDSTIAKVENEGLAMAELVHQIAPGAQLYFQTAEGGQDAFAAGVNALVNAGVNVIVDDFSFSAEPYYQIAGPIDAAIENAVSAGVNYFTSAANYGDAYYENTWQPASVQLVLQSGGQPQTVSAQQFANGTELQTITIPGSVNATLSLQWDAAWPTSKASVPDELGLALYTTSGSLVATSHQVSGAPDFGFTPEVQLSAPLTATATQYQLAVYQIGATAPSQFKYIMFGSPGTIAAADTTADNGGITEATTPGGFIADPQAGIGSGSVHGHQLLPDVNTVGAAYWPNTPAFGIPPDWTEYFSSAGPGKLLFDQNGNPISSPVSDDKVNFVAPDGIDTSVPNFQLFFGTSAAAPDAAAVAALMLQANSKLTPAQITSMLGASAVDMGLPAGEQGAGLIQAPGAVQLALNAVQCFRDGTRILTLEGEIPVEHLRVGDPVRVLSMDEAFSPIVGIRRRTIDCRRHSNPREVCPIRISPGAFGPCQPRAELFLSPDHAVYVDDVLIPVKYLLNGRTIVQVPADRVNYFHLELAEHAILLAEGLPVESYLDTGEPALLTPGVLRTSPDRSAHAREALACAPLIVSGPLLSTVRARLLKFTTDRTNEMKVVA